MPYVYIEYLILSMNSNTLQNLFQKKVDIYKKLWYKYFTFIFKSSSLMVKALGGQPNSCGFESRLGCYNVNLRLF